MKRVILVILAVSLILLPAFTVAFARSQSEIDAINTAATINEANAVLYPNSIYGFSKRFNDALSKLIPNRNAVNASNMTTVRLFQEGKDEQAIVAKEYTLYFTIESTADVFSDIIRITLMLNDNENSDIFFSALIQSVILAFEKDMEKEKADALFALVNTDGKAQYDNLLLFTNTNAMIFLGMPFDYELPGSLFVIERR